MAVSGRRIFGQAPCIRTLVYSNRSPPNYLVPLARLFKEVNRAQSHRERPTSTCVFAIPAATNLTTVSSNPARILFRYEHVFLRIDIAPHAARHVSRGLHCETSPTYTLNGMKSREIHSTFQGNISNVDPTKNVANQQEDNDDKKKRTRNEKQKQMNRSWQIKHSLGAVWEDILPLESISFVQSLQICFQCQSITVLGVSGASKYWPCSLKRVLCHGTTWRHQLRLEGIPGIGTSPMSPNVFFEEVCLVY